jgi:hypothetical protein
MAAASDLWHPHSRSNRGSHRRYLVFVLLFIRALTDARQNLINLAPPTRNPSWGAPYLPAHPDPRPLPSCNR